MSKLSAGFSKENGQILMIGALMATALLGLVGLIVDGGLLYAERRQAQNAADQAALAAAFEMRYGGSDEDAIAAAFENAAANNYDNNGSDNTVTVNIPATQGEYASEDRSIEVIIEQRDVPTFFIHAIAPSAAEVGGRGVAVALGAGDFDPNAPPLPVVIPDNACDATATVDGRVLEGDEGYHKVADLFGETTDYGDAFFACDSNFLYFALRMNGPSTGGGVANENVYASGCGLKYEDGDLEKIIAIVQTVGVNSFTVLVAGVIWTVQVDGETDYDDEIDSFADIVPGMPVEVRVETVLGPQSVLAEKVKVRGEITCGFPFPIVDSYHSFFNTGWGDGDHTFKKLEGSDRARFQISCDGVVKHDFIQDYLRQVGSTWVSDANGDGEVFVAGPNQSASSLEFNLEHPEITGWPYAEIQSPPFNPEYPTFDSQYDNFVWEMIYEFRVPRANYDECTQVTFGLHDFSGSTGGLGGMHSSPAKTDDGAFLRVEPFDVRLVE